VIFALKGIAEKLDHLKDAGIGAVWLSPIYKSPMVDFGYDISNFTDVDPIFGTLDDFNRLQNKAKELGINIKQVILLNLRIHLISLLHSELF
jgi:alpha-glucosidase